MVDAEGRTILYGRQGEPSGLKASPVTTEIPTSAPHSRSGEHVLLVSPRASQPLGTNSPRVLSVTSPRVRDNAISVIHGSQDNIDGISPKSSQTPVEFVSRTNDLRHNQDKARINTHDASNRMRIDQNRYTNNRSDITETERMHNAESRRHSDIDALQNNGHADAMHARRNVETHTNREPSQNNANPGTISTTKQRNTGRQPVQNDAHFNQNAVRERQLDRHADRHLDRYDHSDATNARQSDRHSDRHQSRRSYHGYDNDATTERVRANHHSVGSRSVSSGRTRLSSGRTRLRSARTISTFTEEEDKDERYVVPALPMSLAIVCCVLNFAIPGLGTMLASVGVLCCAKTEDMNFKEKCGSCCTVFGIGVLQLLLVACFLIGWIWSCIWGITFIGMSKNYYQADEEPDPNIPAWERNIIGRTPLPEPQIVENQPYPGIGYDDLRRAYEERRRRRQEHQHQRRSRSRLSDFIYPMRAPSNMAYHSPPPPYEDATGQSNQRSLEVLAVNLEETRRHEHTGQDERTRIPQVQVAEAFRPMNSIIQEEDHIT